MTDRKSGMISLLFAFLLMFNFNVGYAERTLSMDSTGSSVLSMNISGSDESNSSDTKGIIPIGENDVNAAESSVEGTSESAVEATTEQVLLNNEGLELLESYSLVPPEDVDLEHIEYNQYNIGYFYVVAVNNTVNIREKPYTSSPVINKLGYYGKMNVFEKVRGQYFTKSDSDEWYRVYWYEKNEIKTGYVYSKIVRFRTFRLDLAKTKIDELVSYFADHKNMAKISNYKNVNGYPPRYDGKSEDAFGNTRDQSAPLYSTPDSNSDFRYLPDGLIVDVLDEENGYYKVHVFDHDSEGYIPKKYLSFQNQVSQISQAVIVDIKNQNISSYQLTEDKWVLKSLSYATTGMKSEFKEPTVPGTYAAIQKKDKFLYLDDETKELDGYAPYAIRFNGGAYLHGFPVNYKWNTVQELVKDAEYDEQGALIQEAVYEEKRVGAPIDPGLIEYSYTLGTIPLSHKCVRNPTSHAEYLYNWIILDESIIVVLE
ncbi:SH3 domain-containing protein [Fusibacter ferrireducens]|uniref:L,D-transpeptidase n=1 Tax=Fusibacter ferrireducens TaxID=2785058 RepID=A0ABR9ZYW5_9FIRM|nr:SH3 domain-containing protein [Fusibacter ferrireducens]MBF4695650.1 L,D-transpeptidase [Fusibacter ferrireducens]